MNIFLTGATGYIGSKLLQKLVNLGYTVHCLCRHQPDNALFKNSRVKLVRGSLFDKDIIRKGLQGCDEVYHLAAYARPWAKNTNTFFQINVIGTQNILEAALYTKVNKVVFTSTAGTYGHAHGQLIHEDMVRSIEFFSAYESSKFIAEELAMRYNQKGLPVVVIQPTRLYGPGPWTKSNATSAIIRDYLNGNWHVLPGNGRARGNFAFIDDVVNGHYQAMQYGNAGERYILGGINADFKSFLGMISTITEQYPFLYSIPYPMLNVFAWQEEQKAKWLGREPLVTTQWIKRLSHDLVYSSEKAMRELGYSITPLETGLKKTLEWLTQKHHKTAAG
jgi:nucleoside-diphosphate-sugar epimerase